MSKRWWCEDMSRSIQVASCWSRAGASLGLASRKLTRPVTKLRVSPDLTRRMQWKQEAVSSCYSTAIAHTEGKHGMCQHVPTCANMCQWDQMSTCNLANSQHGLGPIQRLFSVKHFKNALQLAWPKSKGAETAKSSTRNTIIERAPTSTENAHNTKCVRESQFRPQG